MLVVVEGDITEAVCAEPVLRAIAQKYGPQCRLTVCHEHADLYTGHPAIACVAYDELEISAGQYHKIIHLKSPDGRISIRKRVSAMAQQIGVNVPDDQPRINLTGFDTLRTQRFGVGSIQRPRLALGLEPTLVEERLQQWNQVCQAIDQHLHGGFVLLAERRTECSTGKNLTGKLMAREAASVLSQCDMLITSEKGYAAMAVAVHIPVILIDDGNSNDSDSEFAGIVAATELSPDVILSAIMSMDFKLK
ncbi:MAG: hypothetical protein ABFD91_00560 [Anaerohalosphaeraceae bacterium]